MAFLLARFSLRPAKEPTFTQLLDAVVVDGGVFSSELQFSAELFKSAAQTWVGVTVSGEAELPRRPFRSVPFAIWASDLDCSGCVSKDELAFAIYTQTEVDAMTADFVTASEVAEQISVGGYAPLASPAEVATSGSFADLNNIPAGQLDGEDDLLRALKCQEGQVAQWTSGLWQCATPANATIIKSLDLPFLDLVSQFIANMPGSGSGGFTVPFELVRKLFGEALDALAAGDLALAQTLAGLVDYELVLTQDIHVLRPLAGADKGRGLFALASTFKRNLVLSSPHPKFDSSSGIRAAEAFLESGATGMGAR
ncbi:MAG TPA: hypothetical protein EYN06_10510 [Myxococcales bacterium]|nr:hypothetical protein [Myxococcales bacterium]